MFFKYFLILLFYNFFLYFILETIIILLVYSKIWISNIYLFSFHDLTWHDSAWLDMTWLDIAYQIIFLSWFVKHYDHIPCAYKVFECHFFFILDYYSIMLNYIISKLLARTRQIASSHIYSVLPNFIYYHLNPYPFNLHIFFTFIFFSTQLTKVGSII